MSAAKNLKNLGEFGLIKHLTKSLVPSQTWPLKIGDDAAVLKLTGSHYQIFTHDLCLENVHFLADSLTDLADAGWKSLAVNLSDVAAMGATPLGAVVGLGIPPKASVDEVEALYKGLKQCAKKFACPVVGGDTNTSKSGWVIAVSVLGKCKQKPKRRQGAKSGDSLWVTGALGAAALGWEIRKRKTFIKNLTALEKTFCKRHARPTPRLAWGEKLGARPWVTSLMDVSDGLAGDLKHLSKASHVGFELQVASLPKLKGFSRLAKKLSLKEESLMLSGGEDYELLFTVRRGQEKRAADYFKQQGIIAAPIGRATVVKKIIFLDKENKPLKTPAGFTHF